MHKDTAKLIVIQCHGNQKYIRISEKGLGKMMKDRIITHNSLGEYGGSESLNLR